MRRGPEGKKEIFHCREEGKCFLRVWEEVGGCSIPALSNELALVLEKARKMDVIPV